MEIRLLRSGDETVLDRVADDVFDNAIDTTSTRTFLASEHHHLAVAIDDGLVVGMASAVHYVHPDKRPELWLNEVGVSSTHLRRGLGRRLLDALFAEGRRIGCKEAWVLTDRSNPSAMRFYESFAGLHGPDDAVMYTFDI